MENTIQISKINDFLFCPMSLYYHSIYEQYSENIYHCTPQIVGKIKHENIEQRRYSTSKHIMQGLAIYCDKYDITGRIDIYDRNKFELVERKYRVSKIFDGHKYQLYAQMFCLEEMGYRVDKLFIHSLVDNKRFEISKPNDIETAHFEFVIDEMRCYVPDNYKELNINKCNKCIYAELCGEMSELC